MRLNLLIIFIASFFSASGQRIGVWKVHLPQNTPMAVAEAEDILYVGTKGGLYSFDLTSGDPTAGPPRRPLPRIHLQIRDGAIYATGVEVRS